MYHAFISYSRRDAAFVRRVMEILEFQAEVKVWFDQDDIPCSLPWLDEVTSAIRCARFVVVFNSLAWFESSNCTLELRTAESLQVPVLNIDTEALPADQAANWITSWWWELSGTRDEKTELLERAYRWDLAKRPRQMLVRGKILKKLRNAGWRFGVPESMPYVSTFLTKSSNRQTLRRLTVAGGVFVAYMVMSQGPDLWAVLFDSAMRELSSPAASASMTNLVEAKVDSNPYFTLDATSWFVQMNLNAVPEKGYVGSN